MKSEKLTNPIPMQFFWLLRNSKKHSTTAISCKKNKSWVVFNRVRRKIIPQHWLEVIITFFCWLNIVVGQQATLAIQFTQPPITIFFQYIDYGILMKTKCLLCCWLEIVQCNYLIDELNFLAVLVFVQKYIRIYIFNNDNMMLMTLW